MEGCKRKGERGGGGRRKEEGMEGARKRERERGGGGDKDRAKPLDQILLFIFYVYADQTKKNMIIISTLFTQQAGLTTKYIA